MYLWPFERSLYCSLVRDSSFYSHFSDFCTFLFQTIINQVFKPSNVQRHTRMKFITFLPNTFSIMEVIQNIRTQEKCRITAAEMRFLRITAGYNLLTTRNETVIKEVGILHIWISSRIQTELATPYWPDGLFQNI
jgi:hypothetical protein